jgi:ligand-binding sensor domain-containing protein
MKQISSLLVLAALALSCSGQVKSDSGSAANTQKKSGTAKVSRPERNNPWPYKQSVDCSIQDKNGDIWFGTTSGLYRYDGKLFTSYTDVEGINTAGIEKMMADKAGNLWFGAKGGIIKYNPAMLAGKANPIFSAITLGGNSIPAIGSAFKISANAMNDTLPVSHLMEDSKGTIWFSVGYHLYSVDKATETAKRTSIGDFLKVEKMKMSGGYPDDFGITGLCEAIRATC